MENTTPNRTDRFSNSFFAILETYLIYGIYSRTHSAAREDSRCVRAVVFTWFRSVSERSRIRMTDQLGFHNLPFLAHRKSVKRGFEFTLMVVGKFVLLTWRSLLNILPPLSPFLYLIR